jgi:hypothetical protein
MSHGYPSRLEVAHLSNQDDIAKALLRIFGARIENF